MYVIYFQFNNFRQEVQSDKAFHSQNIFRSQQK